MAANEKDRNALLRAIEQSFGPEVSDTLSELLPAAGERPATKRDIQGVVAVVNTMDERLTAELRSQRAFTDARFDQAVDQMTAVFERRITDAVNSQIRTLVFSQLGAVVAITALAFGLR